MLVISPAKAKWNIWLTSLTFSAVSLASIACVSNRSSSRCLIFAWVMSRGLLLTAYMRDQAALSVSSSSRGLPCRYAGMHLDDIALSNNSSLTSIVVHAEAVNKSLQCSSRKFAKQYQHPNPIKGLHALSEDHASTNLYAGGACDQSHSRVCGHLLTKLRCSWLAAAIA